MNTMVPLERLTLLFGVLFTIGVGLTLPLFKFDYKKFVQSSLFVKIVFWIPIFAIFLGILYANSPIRVAILCCLLLAALIEFLRVASKTKAKIPLIVYFLFFTVGLAHFFLLGHNYYAKFINLMITICFATVLSDVMAFFLGNYIGKHKLPAWLNNNKSWEGVLGQSVGALLGVLLVNTFVMPVTSIWLFLPLGIGSAIGDLANSYAKRCAGIKDWSKAIPGHGGFLDRLSSMAGSCLALFYFLMITS